ncbi:ATP-binding cassette domain-containing protein, partial [Aphanothece microscopica]|uniref:ATP-binding cassette domain-containing protein n=1 Tax=Aphanothece microscopica TaxID=1049561 RepID=UPI003984839F
MDSHVQTGGLIIEGLVAGYGGGVVLDDLSLAVAPGESVALLGRNGVGKTTLFKLIAGEVPPASGSVATSGKLAVLTQSSTQVSAETVA